MAKGVNEVVKEAIVEPNTVDALLTTWSTECSATCLLEGLASCQVESDEGVNEDHDVPFIMCAAQSL